MQNAALLKFGYGIRSKAILFIAIVRTRIGKARPYSVSLTLDGALSVRVHLMGNRDEFTIMRDLFIGNEYRAPENMKVHTILDLGANIGLAAAWFRLMYPNALIHAYEPAPRTFAQLEKNAQEIGNIKIFDEAIGIQKGAVIFHESNRHVASSLINSPALESSRSISTQMTTIDMAIERIGGHVDLLKMDIEGAEFDALPVATKLSGVKYITGEAHPRVAGRSLEEIRRALSKTHGVTIRGTDENRLAGFYAVLKR